jgi:hypothetical protein
MGINSIHQRTVDRLVDCVVIDMDKNGQILTAPAGICPIPHYSVLMESLAPFSQKIHVKSPQDRAKVMKSPFRTSVEEKVVVDCFLSELNRFQRTLLVAILSNIRNSTNGGEIPFDITDEGQVAKVAAKIEDGDEVSSRFYSRLLLSQHFQFYYEKVHVHL